jgi:hypothetical protein
MSAKRLPRELRQTINRMAHEYAQSVGGSLVYGRRYADEKARLQALVVTWIAAGSTSAEALAKLHGGLDSMASKMRETLKALRQQIKEMR